MDPKPSIALSFIIVPPLYRRVVEASAEPLTDVSVLKEKHERRLMEVELVLELSHGEEASFPRAASIRQTVDREIATHPDHESWVIAVPSHVSKV